MISIAAIATAFLLSMSPWGRYLELKSYDLRMNLRGGAVPEEKIAIIYIDDESRSRIPDPMIFWHPFYGRVFTALSEAGARVVGFDVVFEIPVNPWSDGIDDKIAADYLQATGAGTPIVAAIHRTQNRAGLPFYMLAMSQEQFGSIDLTRDEDGIIRRQKLTFESEEGGDVPSFALRIASLGAGEPIREKDGRLYLGNRPITLDSDGNLRINFRKRNDRLERFSFQDVLARAKAGDTGFLRESFRDKIVLIGTEDIEDQHLKPTPSERGRATTPGVEIHAQTLFTLIDGDFIRPAPPGMAWGLTGILVGIFTFLSFRGGPWAGLAGLVFLLLAVSAAGAAALGFNYDVPLIPPLMGLPLSYAAVFTYRFRVEFKNRWRIQRIFGQYLPEPLVRKIAESGAEEQMLGGSRQRITVLFSDIRDFTTLTEKRAPEELVHQLNEYLAGMTNIVFANDGMVDKFIGDGILALFGAPVPSPDHAPSAVKAAVGMLRELERLNEGWAARGWPPLQIGIGIHSGDVIVGNIGSRRKMEYTALGDTVNVASRIEGMTKKYAIPLLMTAATAEGLDGHWEAECVGTELLKGKSESTRLFALRSMMTH